MRRASIVLASIRNLTSQVVEDYRSSVYYLKLIVRLGVFSHSENEIVTQNQDSLSILPSIAGIFVIPRYSVMRLCDAGLCLCSDSERASVGRERCAVSLPVIPARVFSSYSCGA